MVVGAGFFILVQLVLLIEFAYSWNESWLRKMEDEEMDGNKRFYYFLLTATFGLIGGSIALTGVMYVSFLSLSSPSSTLGWLFVNVRFPAVWSVEIATLHITICENQLTIFVKPAITLTSSLSLYSVTTQSLR
jgi:hypothetical protein